MLLNLAGTLFSLDTPRVMGVLNLTPDSFYAGSRHLAPQAAVDQAAALLEQGADILDLGAYSSRPGAEDISPQEEADRLLPALEAIRKALPQAFLSIDTFRASVLRQAAPYGIHLANDISGGQLDPELWPTVAQLGLPYLLMHMRGTPQTMSGLSQYDNLMVELLDYFSFRLAELRGLGVRDVVIDPGIGFAKTPAQGFTILKHLAELDVLGCPILVGVSRKSLVWRTLGLKPEEALNGTTALHMLALMNGARLLRVHDPAEARQVVRLFAELKSA